VGIIFQSFHLVATMTELENVAILLELSGRRDVFDKAAEELDAVGLGGRLGHYPSQLSSGEQQRVALARALACVPKLLFADELTGNLDRATGDSIIDLEFALKAAQAMNLILITHDPDLAERCDRMMAMEDGRIDQAGGSDQFQAAVPERASFWFSLILHPSVPI